MKRVAILALLLLGFALSVQAQTNVTLTPVPRIQFLDTSGNPLANGHVHAYISGTTTDQATYSESTGTTLNANPVVLDSGGFANIWLSDGLAYTLAVHNSSDVQQYSIDGVSSGDLETALVVGTTAVTFSSTPTFDSSANTYFSITLTGNVTSSTISNAIDGRVIYFNICQDATGGRTFVWATTVLTAPTIGSAASVCTSASFIFDGTNWRELAASSRGSAVFDTITVGLRNSVIYLDGNKYAKTRAGLVAAIAAATSGECVVIPPNTTITISSTDGVVTWNSTNACLLGSGPSSVIATSGTGAFTGLSFSGTAGSTANLASDAAADQTQLTLVAGSVASLSLVVGDLIWIDDTQTEPDSEVTHISVIAGEVLTLEDPLYTGFETARGARVRKLTALDRVTLGNFRFDGSGNTGTDSLGIVTLYTVNSTVSNIWANGVTGAAIRMGVGYQNKMRNVFVRGGGSTLVSILEWRNNTALQVENIHSSQATGFGPQCFYCTASQFANLYSIGGVDRGFKVRRTFASSFTNIISSGHVGATSGTGIAVTNGSVNNFFSNCHATGNEHWGIWLPGSPDQGNNFNVFVNCLSVGNTAGDLLTDTGNDSNVFIMVRATNITDSGAGNMRLDRTGTSEWNLNTSIRPGTSTFSALGTPANGVIVYCSDCTIANPCAGSGTGALAKRLNGVWVCN